MNSAEMGYKTWVENDVLFAHFESDMTASMIERALKDGLALIEQNQKKTVPYIITFEKGIQTSVSLGGLGKIVDTPILKHVSIVCIVDVESTGKHLLEMLNHYFLNDKLVFCPNIEAAKIVVQKHKDEQSPMLER